MTSLKRCKVWRRSQLYGKRQLRDFLSLNNLFLATVGDSDRGSLSLGGHLARSRRRGRHELEGRDRAHGSVVLDACCLPAINSTAALLSVENEWSTMEHQEQVNCCWNSRIRREQLLRLLGDERGIHPLMHARCTLPLLRQGGGFARTRSN